MYDAYFMNFNYTWKWKVKYIALTCNLYNHTLPSQNQPEYISSEQKFVLAFFGKTSVSEIGWVYII